MGWPGNFCLTCGLDDPIEAAIVCRDCHVPYGPEDEDQLQRLCPEHARLAQSKCHPDRPNDMKQLRLHRLELDVQRFCLCACHNTEHGDVTLPSVLDPVAEITACTGCEWVHRPARPAPRRPVDPRQPDIETQ